MEGKSKEEMIQSIKEYTYEKSRHLMDFHVAGFTYYDGLDVIEELTLGRTVDLVSEADNPYDPEAVAIYYQERKIGYVPKDKNALLSTLLYFGHENILETRIQYANKETHPERQFRVVVKIKDSRK
ncbi:HIRAN domain-containing protein [Gracilibacillus phocaeensis]|uniref:HIRAN domain-containing protein n=1 Tax=Gracilibacillus phocaeensis TaxID=2042304 RepID=UPI00102FBB22|nr:HIRAN domain-containing protein [Gracilibacillus phocaeensis]